jgi:hypothetical protein
MDCLLLALHHLNTELICVNAHNALRREIGAPMFNIIKDLVFGFLFLGMGSYALSASPMMAKRQFQKFCGVIMVTTGALVLTGLAWRLWIA